jgi:alpha-D-ribose 1-methylphosphonate 5-triphosphate synthase subunit PhnG
VRGTGGNRFIPADATQMDLLRAVIDGLADLKSWADGTGRTLDLGAITVDTKRISNGRISVTVTADLKDGAA